MISFIYAIIIEKIKSLINCKKKLKNNILTINDLNNM